MIGYISSSYDFYMATVVSIVSGHDVRIHTRHGNC